MKSICLVTALALSGLFAGCTLDNPTDGPQTPPLTLQIDPNLSLINLSWSKVNVTGFEEYILLQSHLAIPDEPEPEVNQNVTVVTRIDDVDVNSFGTINTLFTPQACYKLYAKVGERFIYSPTVCVEIPVDLISGFYDRVGYNEHGHELVMFDRVNRFISLYDLDSRALTGMVPENNLSFPVIDVTTHQGITSAYFFDQNVSSVRKYSLPGLGFINQKQIFDGLVGGLAAGPFVLVATQNASASFQVWDAETFVARDTRPGFTGIRHYAAWPGDTLTVLEVWETGMRRYRINSLGKVVEQDDFLTGVSQVSTQNSSDFNDQFYIGGRFSTIVDKNANILGSLNEDLNTFALFNRLTEDGTRAIALIQDQASFFLDIYDITNVTSPQRINRFALPSASYAEMIVKDGTIYIVGINFNSSITQSFILKIPVVS